MSPLQKIALDDPFWPGRFEDVPSRHHVHKSNGRKRLVVDVMPDGLVWHAEIHMGWHESSGRRVERCLKDAEEVLAGVGDESRQEVRPGRQWLHVRRPLTEAEMGMLP